MHRCPYNRQPSVAAISALHAILHDLEKDAFSVGPEFGGGARRGTRYLPRGWSTTIPAESRRCLSQPRAGRPATPRTPHVPTALRRYARVVKDSAAPLGSDAASEKSDSFFWGSVVCEVESLDNLLVTVGTTNSLRKTYAIEDLQL